MIQLNPNFFNLILGISKKHFVQRSAPFNAQASSIKQNSFLQFGQMPKSSLKFNATQNFDKENSELHPFTFQQSQVNQATLTSNMHKLNIKTIERNEGYSNDNKAEANSIFDEYCANDKRYFEIKISTYRICFLNCNGMVFVGVFGELALTKVCKVVLLHLFATYTNSNFSEYLKSGFNQLSKEDVIKTKIYEVIWFRLIMGNLKKNLTKLINTQQKGYTSFELENYYLISMNRYRKHIATELNSFIFNQNNYCILVDFKEISNKPKTDYLKNELIFKELVFQGELLKNLFLKEQGYTNDADFDLAIKVINLIIILF